MKRDYYRVDVASGTPGCRFCGHGKYWTVIYTDEQGEVVEIGTSWADEEMAEDVCDLMNMAHDAGADGAGCITKLGG